MTDRTNDPLYEACRARWEAIADDIAAGNPGPPWDEVAEAQIAHASDTYDEETGRSRPLLRRRGR